MLQRAWPLTLFAVLSAAALATRRAEAGPPFDIGCRSQLFIDRVLVDTATGVSFTLHPARKHPANPIERSAAIYDAEEGVYKSWGHRPLATSIDGLTWQTTSHKPWTQFGYASIIKDAADRDPARRYKIIAWGPNAGGAATNTGYHPPSRAGYNTYLSPDGIQLATLSPKPIWPGGDVITGYYDRERQRFVAFPKTSIDTGGFHRRCFSVMTSTDFERWTQPKLVFVPDQLDDAGAPTRVEEARPILDAPVEPAMIRTEFYGVGGFYQGESCVVAFPWMITVSGKGRYGPQEGPGEVQLAVSRDLDRWERPFRTPAIPRGNIGQWDCGFFKHVGGAFQVGDEIWLYYNACNYGHGHPVKSSNAPPELREKLRAQGFVRGNGLAIWKRDRFVSADANAGGGALKTVPLVFRGNRLELNALTRAKGSIVAELWNAEGGRISRSKPVSGDSLRHRIVWEEPVELASWAGRPIVLRFRMESAELYAFAFRK